MRIITGFFKWVFGLGFVAGVLATVVVALAAALGFASPLLDFLNNLQPIIFSGTILCLVLGPIFVRLPRLRALSTALAATAFLASAIIVVPEFVARFAPREPLPEGGQATYKILTHNVFGRNDESMRTVAAILNEDPDILTFQEYFYYQREGMHALLENAYPYNFICRGGKRANIAVYAKIPFEATPGGACTPGDSERTSRITAQFTTDDGKSFSIMTTHLDWPLQVSKFDDGADLAEGMFLATSRQQGQFADTSEALTQVPGPLLLAGDFNSTSWSYTLKNFAQAAGMKRETRTMLTYPARWSIGGWRDVLPVLPLDHIMTRGGVTVHEIYAGDPAGSDHKSVVATFSINP